MGAYSLIAPDAQCGPRCPEHVEFLPANFRRYAALRPVRDCEVTALFVSVIRLAAKLEPETASNNQAAIARTLDPAMVSLVGIWSIY